MGTHDISLPSRATAVFPPRCVACEMDHPTSQAKVSVTGASEGPSLTEGVIDAALGGGGGSRASSNMRVTVHAPACPGCAKSIERRHFWKTVALYGGALGGVLVGVVIMAELKSVTFGIIAILAGVLIPVIWELTSPPAFTITPSGKTTVYELKSSLCAREFAAANGVVIPEPPPPLPSDQNPSIITRAP